MRGALKADKSHGKYTIGNCRKDANVNQTLLIPDATVEQRELLSMALSDAVFYRDPPPTCDDCQEPYGLCEECGTGVTRARAYRALTRAFGLKPPPLPTAQRRTGEAADRAAASP